MDYISVSSLVSDFWSLFFFPLIRISLMILLMRYIFGKDRFNRLKSKLFDNILQYSQKIKYRERLNKAAPIVSMFLFFSFLYLFSIFCSTVESFIYLNISFGNDNYLSSETVLNVWQYHPYIEDFSTLQDVVYYKAEESELGTYEILSTRGLRNLPETLIESLIVFVLSLLIFLIVFSIIKIIKRGFFKRIFMIFRAILVLITLTLLLAGIRYLNKNYTNNYTIRAWEQYESQLFSSGAPPESDIDIKKDKLDEVDRYIDSCYNDFEANIGFGTIGVSITYTNYGFKFHVIHYRY